MMQAASPKRRFPLPSRRTLLATGAVARREADRFAAAAITSEQDAAHATALLAVSQDSSGVTAALKPGLQAALAKAQAKVGQAQAALALARQERRHPIVLAPIDGVVGNRQVHTGDYVQPGTRLRGIVDSFAPGSGSSFALLPFEPGTGNFTKIVQRVSVRIRFEPGQPGVDLLRPGLSVTAKVRLSDPENDRH